MIRTLLLVPIAIVCLAAAPATLVTPPVERAAAISQTIPSVAEFEALLRLNPVAALEASLAKQQRDVRGYSCLFQKQERIRGKLGEVDLIRHAVREEPFATTLVWEQGGGPAKAILYVRGDNGGRMKVKSRFLLTTNTDPNGLMARSSSRYSVEDAGIRNGTLRSLQAWKHDATLSVQYLGRQPIKELNRECYVLKRTIAAGEVDSFRMSDLRPTVADAPEDAFTTLTIYLDCETWLQVGSVLERKDGSLLGAYWFKDVIVNPAFDAKQFTPAILN